MDREKKEKLKKKLCSELENLCEKIERGGMTNRNDLDTIHLLTDTIKNLEKMDMLEEGNSYGGTRGMYMDDNSMRRGMRNSYDRGYMSRDGYGSDNSGREYSIRGSYGQMTEANRQQGMLQMTQTMQDMLNNNQLSMQERDTIERALEIMRV